MKRIVLCLAIGAGLILGCSDTQAVATAAGLSGTYDLAIAGQYVFVTSSDRNELRVLDLAADPRGFVPAPNPLEALSIPVLERPTYLTRDVSYRLVYDNEAGNETPIPRGEEVGGPYVYARSDGAQAISVVAAGPEYLAELAQLRNLGFVTAFAARAPEMGGSQSILYYATQAGADARLHRKVLPGPEVLSEASEEELEQLETTPGTMVLNLPGEAVAALLVLPSDGATQGEQLAVATRGTAGATGRTFRLDLTNPDSLTLVPLNFGAPVRQLATHPVVPNAVFGDEQACGMDTTQPPRESLRAGEYIFGVLDESTCGGGNECSGVLAVDSQTGNVAEDSTGYSMIPIRTSGGLPTGITFAQRAAVQIRCFTAGRNEETNEPTLDIKTDLQRRPLVGMIPSSDGQITLFDAAKLRPFNFNTPNPTTLERGPSVSNLSIVDAAGASKLPENADASPYLGVELRNGATRTDIYRLVFEGPLPSPRRRTFASGVNCPQGSGSCTFEVGSTQEAQFLLAQDLIVLEGGGGEVCELPVISKDESVPAQVRLVTGPLPEGLGCEAHRRFSVRAGANSAAPFAVYSDTRGFEGRLAPGQTLELAGDYLYHPVGFTNEQPVFRARITLQRTVGTPVRGDQYTASVQSGFVPYVLIPDSGNISAGLSGYRLPGPVSHTRVGDVDFAYIAYPSADGILQINLATLLNTSPGLVPFQ